MALFSRIRPRIENGIAGRAKILVSEPSGEPGLRENSGESIFELELNHFGTRAYRFVLEVSVEGRAPYEVDGEFKVPRRAENTGWLAAKVGNSLKPGLTLPVVVDPRDPGRVEVDWPKFLADPSRKQAQETTDQTAYNAKYRAMIERDPKLAAKLREGNALAVRSWADTVRAGRMSREDFEAQVTTELESGRMDPADAEAARASLDPL